MEKPKQASISTKSGEPFEVTKEGSLGLLALGYIGLMMWRKKRAEDAQAQSPEQI